MSAKPAFTPGPWQFSIAKRSDGEIIVSHVLTSGGTEGYERAVCQLYGHGNQEANARLIAAAPEMHAALRRLTTLSIDYCNPREDRELDAAIEEAQAALIKAGDPEAIAAEEEWMRIRARTEGRGK